MQHGRFAMRDVSALFVGVFALAAPLASAAVAVSPGVLPSDASGCTGTLSGNQIENCVNIVGAASYLQTVKGSA